jgi:hypothetical protein
VHLELVLGRDDGQPQQPKVLDDVDEAVDPDKPPSSPARRQPFTEMLESGGAIFPAENRLSVEFLSPRDFPRGKSSEKSTPE